MDHNIDIRHDKERQFLRALRSHDEEITSADRVFTETVRATAALKDLGKCMTVFGSARFAEDHRDDKLAEQARE